MKKLQFTIMVCAITSSAFAQPKFAQITGPEKDRCIRQEQVRPDMVNQYSSETMPGQKLYNNTIIGTTWV